MDNSTEFAIEWVKGDEKAVCTFPSSTAYKNAVMQYAEQYPDKVKIRVENKDGSVVAEVPVKWIQVRKPREMNYSEEERARISERLHGNGAELL